MKDFLKKLGRETIKALGITLAFAGSVAGNTLPPTPEKGVSEKKVELVVKMQQKVMAEDVLRANNTLPPTPENKVSLARIEVQKVPQGVMGTRVFRSNNTLPPTPECIAKNRVKASRVMGNRQHVYC